MHIELIGVPFDGYGRPGNQARAAEALRATGLRAALRDHRVRDDDLDLPVPVTERGPDTSLINEPALIAMTEALHERVGRAVAAARFPFVYGGDCSSLLGILTGLRDAVGEVGLLFVDGHEDTMPLDASEDGEAANVEIGLLLGLTGRLLGGPLHRLLTAPRAALRADTLAMLGPRDTRWRQHFNVGSLRDHGVWLRDVDEVAADPDAAARHAVEHLSTDRWWLHVDLDVLDPEQFTAQGLPGVEDEPGGLTWAQLTALLVGAVGTGSCIGWSVAIYDPDQDPDASDARRIVGLVAEVMGALGEAANTGSATRTRLS